MPQKTKLDSWSPKQKFVDKNNKNNKTDNACRNQTNLMKFRFNIAKRTFLLPSIKQKELSNNNFKESIDFEAKWSNLNKEANIKIQAYVFSQITKPNKVGTKFTKKTKGSTTSETS